MQYQLTRRTPRRAARFRNNIREYRLKAGFSQARLATLLGIHRDTVSSWERGAALPPVPKLMRMAKLLATLSEALYIDYYALLPEVPGPINAPSV